MNRLEEIEKRLKANLDWVNTVQLAVHDKTELIVQSAVGLTVLKERLADIACLLELVKDLEKQLAEAKAEIDRLKRCPK